MCGINICDKYIENAAVQKIGHPGTAEFCIVLRGAPPQNGTKPWTLAGEGETTETL